MTLQPPSTVFLPLSKVFKSLLKLFSPVWEPAWLSERIKPYIITCGLFGEFLSRNLWPHWQVSAESGERRGLKCMFVARAGCIDSIGVTTQGQMAAGGRLCPRRTPMGDQAVVSWQLRAAQWARRYSWYPSLRASQSPNCSRFLSVLSLPAYYLCLTSARGY